MKLPEASMEVMAQGARREMLRAALPVLRQSLAEMEEAELKQAFDKLSRGELTAERAYTILSTVRSFRLLEQKFATWVELED